MLRSLIGRVLSALVSRYEQLDVSLEDVVVLAVTRAFQLGNPVTERRLHKVVAIVVRELGLSIAVLRPGYFGPEIPELKDVVERLSGVYIEAVPLPDGDRVLRPTKLCLERADEIARKLRKSSAGRRLLTLVELWAPTGLDVVLFHVYTKYPDLLKR